MRESRLRSWELTPAQVPSHRAYNIASLAVLKKDPNGRLTSYWKVARPKAPRRNSGCQLQQSQACWCSQAKFCFRGIYIWTLLEKAWTQLGRGDMERAGEDANDFFWFRVSFNPFEPDLVDRSYYTSTCDAVVSKQRSNKPSKKNCPHQIVVIGMGKNHPQLESTVTVKAQTISRLYTYSAASGVTRETKIYSRGH